jgi:hypothetical protein
MKVLLSRHGQTVYLLKGLGKVVITEYMVLRNAFLIYGLRGERRTKLSEKRHQPRTRKARTTMLKF